MDSAEVTGAARRFTGELPPCVSDSLWEDVPVPAKMRREGIVRAVGAWCTDPECTYGADGPPGPGNDRVHFVLFGKGQVCPFPEPAATVPSPKLPPGAVRTQPKRGKSRAARRKNG